MPHSHADHHRAHGRYLFMLGLALLVAGAAVTWAWNGAGVSLFGLPPATFAQAGAVLIALIAVATLIKFVIAPGRRPL